MDPPVYINPANRKRLCKIPEQYVVSTDVFHTNEILTIEIIKQQKK